MALLGAAGGIGQPLALLLKMNPLISHLALYDVAPVTLGALILFSSLQSVWVPGFCRALLCAKA